MKTNNREHELIKEAFVVIERVGWDKFSLLDLFSYQKNCIYNYLATYLLTVLL